MAMTIGQTTDGLADMVDFQDIKTWIATQEAFQASTSRPVTLTVAQRKALAQLKLPAHPQSEVEFGKTDWISLLHQYRDTHRHIGVAISFTEEAHDSQFLGTCSFSEKALPKSVTFPNQDSGFIKVDPDGALIAPAFSNKRDARRYAAKSCVEWLMKEGRMPKDGSSAVFPKPKNNSPSPGRPSGPIDPYNDALPATQRVPVLCSRLGMPPPQYRLENAGGSLWDGELVFNGPIRDIPDDLGRVEGIYGKSLAKDMMATELLGHLQRLEAKRKRHFDDFD